MKKNLKFSPLDLKTDSTAIVIRVELVQGWTDRPTGQSRKSRDRLTHM